MKKISKFLRLFVVAFLASSWHYCNAQEITVSLSEVEKFENAGLLAKKKVAFIDLSELNNGPHIVVADIKGKVLSRFPIPPSRFAVDWINWGPGISFDSNRRSIWYLAPKVGLTEFDLMGNVKQTIDYPNASHQIQHTSEGGFVLPYSWDTSEDYQLSELDAKGNFKFGWRAASYTNSNPFSVSVAPRQPKSFTATTSAVKTSKGNYFLSLSQMNRILKINNKGEVLDSINVSIRPHTLVVEDDDLIGYSARDPNRIVVKNKSCNCFKEIFIEENLPGKSRTRSLSLQSLGSGLWFSSGVDRLYILDDQGKVFWQLQHDQLKGRPNGFHSAVIFEWP